MRYLKEYKRVTYTTLLTNGTLNGYLVDIGEQAQDMFSRLIKQIAPKEGITEMLKVENQMLWIQRMGNIQIRAREIVNTELIFN